MGNVLHPCERRTPNSRRGTVLVPRDDALLRVSRLVPRQAVKLA